MPLFDYTGQLQSGAAFAGTLEAESRAHADAMLADMGVRVLTLRPASRFAWSPPLSVDDFLFFNEQISALTKSGLPLEEGLRNLAADVGSRRLKRLLLILADDLAGGAPLDQAIAKREASFPAAYAGVIKAGLGTGDLGGTLYGLSAHLRLRGNMRRALFELAAYPVIILLASLAILSFIMRVVIPQLEDVIQDQIGAYTSSFGTFNSSSIQRVSAAAAALFDLSHAWPQIELVFTAGVAAAILGGIVLQLVPAARSTRERIVRRLPGFAQVYWCSVLARFTHTAALAAHGGTPLPQLLAAAGAASGSVALGAAAKRVAGGAETGLSLREAARVERDIPALWTCVAESAAQRGELAPALSALAQTYELRASQWASVVRLLLGPVLLVGVGTVIGGIIFLVIAALVPMINALSF